MLYNRFKHAYLLGDGEEVSTTFLRSLLDEKEKEEEEQRQERLPATEEGSDGAEEAPPQGDQTLGAEPANLGSCDLSNTCPCGAFSRTHVTSCF